MTWYKITFHTVESSGYSYFVRANRKPTDEEARARLGYTTYRWDVDIEELDEDPVLEWLLP